MQPSLPPIENWTQGNTDPLLISDRVLWSRLAQTIAWCSSLKDPEQFRSPALKPRTFHHGPDDLVCDVGHTRELWFNRHGFEAPSELPDLLGGNLMVYFPDADLCDGVAEVESLGFFDVFNTPPYDTWVAYFDDGANVLSASYRSYVVCYVPRHSIEIADAGITVNPEECILWLNQAEVQFTERFRILSLDSPKRNRGL